VLLSDQLSKQLVTKNLRLSESIPVIKGIFHISLVHNRGAAFGIFKGQHYFFIATAIIAVMAILYQFKKNSPLRINLFTLGLALIIAGALGNLIDRLAYGYVIDFLDLRIWPVFNLADSAVTVGVFLLGWRLLRKR
jgi:signal peptidase II